MKTVRYEIKVIDENCTGCYLCEQICPTGAIVMVGPKSSALAVVNNDKCVACFRCVDICEDDALLVPERAVPFVAATDVNSVDPAAIFDLCDRAGCSPDVVACPCSMTLNREVAAAILKGAHTMADLALNTGIQSGCLMYCIAPAHRLLTTHLGIAPVPTSKHKWYPTDYVLADISDEVAAKHPEFFIAEEKALIGADMDAKRAAAHSSSK